MEDVSIAPIRDFVNSNVCFASSSGERDRFLFPETPRKFPVGYPLLGEGRICKSKGEKRNEEYMMGTLVTREFNIDQRTFNTGETRRNDSGIVCVGSF